MKHRLLTLALALCALLAASGFTYRAPEPQKWEYMISTSRLVLDDKAEANDLNAAGLGGWELVSVERDGRSRTYFFKRPK
jgi:hypothetical protein